MTLMLRSLGLVGAGLIARGAPAAAQLLDRPSPAVSFLAGPSSYDLSGTGTGVAAAIRFEVPSGRILIIEPGIGFFRYRTQFGQSIKYLLPEISLQIQPGRGPVRPYVGVGAGFSEYLTGPGASPATVHAVAGIRARIAGNFGVRGELRIRGLDPFHGGRMSDVVFGLTKRVR